MLLDFMTRLLLDKGADGTSGSSPQDKTEDDDIDKAIKAILDGEENEPEDKEVPKKDPAFTKQFAKRLKEERDKVAKQLGFESFDEALKGATRKEIADAGYDPDDPDFKKAVEAAVKHRLETDPEIAEQRKLLEQFKAQEAKTWERQQLEALEKEYGVKLKSLSDADSKTKELMAKGLDLTDAYFIANKPKLKEKQGTGKEHLQPDAKNGAKGSSDDKIVVTQADIDRFREFSNGNETDDQIRARLEKLRGIKK